MNNKSILVIDTPKSCDYFPAGRIFGMDGAVECMVGKDITVNRDGTTIPNWCPLKEIPEKLNADDYLDDDREPFTSGYNACIDEVLKEHD